MGGEEDDGATLDFLFSSLHLPIQRPSFWGAIIGRVFFPFFLGGRRRRHEEEEEEKEDGHCAESGKKYLLLYL